MNQITPYPPIPPQQRGARAGRCVSIKIQTPVSRSPTKAPPASTPSGRPTPSGPTKTPHAGSGTAWPPTPSCRPACWPPSGPSRAARPGCAWVAGRRWRDEPSPQAQLGLQDLWWESKDGVRAMGQRLGLPYSMAELGNAYTDDELLEHNRRYRERVFAAAGAGPWSQRRTA